MCVRCILIVGMKSIQTSVIHKSCIFTANHNLRNVNKTLLLFTKKHCRWKYHVWSKCFYKQIIDWHVTKSRKLMYRIGVYKPIFVQKLFENDLRNFEKGMKKSTAKCWLDFHIVFSVLMSVLIDVKYVGKGQRKRRWITFLHIDS